MHCGVGDGSHRRYQNQAAGPGGLPEGRAAGAGRVANPGHLTRRHQPPHPGALVQDPQRAKSACSSVHCGAGDGPRRPDAPRPQQTGSGPWPPALRTDRRRRLSGPHRTPLDAIWAAPATRAHHCGGARPRARQEDAGTRPPPPHTHTRQAEQRIRAGNAEGHGPPERPYQRLAPEPRDGGGERAHRGSASTGQPDRARRKHRRRGMAYQQARARNTRMGQSVTRTARGARKGGIRGEEAGTGPGPAPLTSRERRTHMNRALHSPRQLWCPAPRINPCS